MEGTGDRGQKFQWKSFLIRKNLFERRDNLVKRSNCTGCRQVEKSKVVATEPSDLITYRTLSLIACYVKCLHAG